MPDIMPGRLRAFLIEHCTTDVTNSIMRTLRPLMDMAERGQFDYSPEVNHIDHHLADPVKIVTGIECADISCRNASDGLIPYLVDMDAAPDRLDTRFAFASNTLSAQHEEDLAFALLHSFMKELCASMNDISHIGRFRRPADDLWHLVRHWVAAEVASNPEQANVRQALRQLVEQAAHGWIPLGITTQPSRTPKPDLHVLHLAGARACYIPLPFAS